MSLIVPIMKPKISSSSFSLYEHIVCAHELNESGATAFDSKSSFDGDNNGNPLTLQPGNDGSSYYLDGSDDYIDVGNIGHLGTQYSVEALIKIVNSTPNGIIACIRTDDMTNYTHIGLQLDYYQGNVRLIVRGDNNSAVVASKAIIENTWQHVVGVRDGNSLYCYVENAFSQANAYIATVYMNRYIIGALFDDRFDTIYGFSNGNIDFVRIYNKALSSDEVNYLFNNGNYISLANIS